MKKSTPKDYRITKSKIRNILVPLDGSRNSIRALNAAIKLSKYTKSKTKSTYTSTTKPTTNSKSK